MSYRNAIRNVEAAIEDGIPVLLLNYEELPQTASVIKTVGSFLGVTLERAYHFEVKSQPRIFIEEEEQIIRSELIDTGSMALYESLSARATAQRAF